jgi:hypothetical protein
LKQSKPKDSLQYWALKSKPLGFPKLKPHRYVTFDIDQGGLNNIRLVFEYVAVIAAITGRTLVLPPAKPWYLINIGPIEGGEPGGVTHIGDVIDIPALAKSIRILTTEEFILEASEHLNIPAEHRTAVPSTEVDALAIRDNKWSDWLYENTEIIRWNPYDSIICIPNVESVGDPSNSLESNLTEAYRDGRNLVEFTPRMNASAVLHFPSRNGLRSLGPVATMLGSINPIIPKTGRRLLKQHVRYRPEIFEIANQLISTLGFSKFNALHIRRNDFQYKQTRLNAEIISSNVKPIFNTTLPLYIATDESSEEFIEVFSKDHQVYLWQDILDATEISTEIPRLWVGPIEQLVCAASNQFAGTDLSTFSSYIHRIRGYKDGPDTECFFHSIDYNTDDHQKEQLEFDGRTYLRENPLFWLDC